ncbi:MAG: DUF2213 domain-containing protein [Lachnospiraceae bacterium]|nr:DUF2213 domain-containing protein [Lachnospiraceae bacterium]
MISYYGYTISPNQIETGEGFLICRNVPIARTGTQEYLGREIGLEGKAADAIVTVYRSSSEVFSEAALASFEGKPATNNHPPDLIGPDDVSMYEKGHVQNVRRGTGEWKDFVIADLHIHDRELIEAVQNGKREISCGYECEYIDNGDGTYSQVNIRGNHVAVVDRGRAGKRAAILDSDTRKKEQAPIRPERKKMKKSGLLFKLFGQAVRDKSPEEIEQMAMDAAAALEEEEKTAEDEAGEKEEVKPAGDELAKENGNSQEALVAAVVKQVLAAITKAQESEKDPIDAAIEKLEGEKEKPTDSSGTEEDAKVVSAEEMDQNASGMDSVAATAILKAMRPAVAAIKNPGERKAVSDALIRCVTAADGRDDISAIIQVSQRNAQKAADSKKLVHNDEIQAKYDAMNPHKRKENN